MKMCSLTAVCLYFKWFINRKPARRSLSTRTLLRTSWHFTMKSQLQKKKITAPIINLYTKFYCSANKSSFILIVLHLNVAETAENTLRERPSDPLILSSIKLALISAHWRTNRNKMQYFGEENTPVAIIQQGSQTGLKIHRRFEKKKKIPQQKCANVFCCFVWGGM